MPWPKKATTGCPSVLLIICKKSCFSNELRKYLVHKHIHIYKEKYGICCILKPWSFTNGSEKLNKNQSYKKHTQIYRGSLLPWKLHLLFRVVGFQYDERKITDCLFISSLSFSTLFLYSYSTPIGPTKFPLYNKETRDTDLCIKKGNPTYMCKIPRTPLHKCDYIST